MISKIVVGALCVVNLVVFVCDPNKHMLNGIVSGMLLVTLLLLTRCC